MKSTKLIAIAFVLVSAAAVFAQNDRPVIVVGKPTPKPTVQVITTPTPAVTPKPMPSVVPTPAPASIASLGELQSKIRLSASRYETRRGQIGIKIVSLDTGKVIYEENAEKYFMPASNMKNFTIATAIERLTPNFRFVTSVFSNSRPDAAGAIKGDLTIYGRGDMSFSTSFFEKDYFKAIDDLADAIVRAGVKRIEGNLVGDESYFSGFAIPGGWEWDDLQWYYGAEVSALPFNDNAVDLSIRGASVGAPCIVNILPLNPVMRIINTCTTTAAKSGREPSVKKGLDDNTVEIGGTMPAGEEYSNKITVSRPAELFIALLKERLEKKGIVITGQRKLITRRDKIQLAVTSSVPPIEIARQEGPPFSVVAAKTMKPSQNLYTETILWTLGEQGRAFPVPQDAKSNPFLDSKSTSSERGIFVVRNFLNEIGVAPDGIIQWDGSGLSRHNLVTPAAVVTLYTYMAKQSRYSTTWMDSLTIGGVDGTLRNRFKGTKTQGNVRGKTGTIDQVSALSGYVTTSSGEKAVFSIIVNGVNDGRLRVSVIDEIVGHIANYSGLMN
ncbi:MAG: D-alanyl-D-alanine carboxypeptidase/D-alanyl-D-alanine-endopeptidase [Acidobacteria bacterium]|nr:D-alanyl-D-alanine carboxypeptidase/D-alanyl-D-alanine-endopeptidase [Acidobacteriota bacterium]